MDIVNKGSGAHGFNTSGKQQKKSAANVLTGGINKLMEMKQKGTSIDIYDSEHESSDSSEQWDSDTSDDSTDAEEAEFDQMLDPTWVVDEREEEDRANVLMVKKKHLQRLQEEKEKLIRQKLMHQEKIQKQNHKPTFVGIDSFDWQRECSTSPDSSPQILTRSRSSTSVSDVYHHPELKSKHFNNHPYSLSNIHAKNNNNNNNNHNNSNSPLPNNTKPSNLTPINTNFQNHLNSILLPQLSPNSKLNNSTNSNSNQNSGGFNINSTTPKRHSGGSNSNSTSTSPHSSFGSLPGYPSSTAAGNFSQSGPVSTFKSVALSSSQNGTEWSTDIPPVPPTLPPGGSSSTSSSTTFSTSTSSSTSTCSSSFLEGEGNLGGEKNENNNNWKKKLKRTSSLKKLKRTASLTFLSLLSDATSPNLSSDDTTNTTNINTNTISSSSNVSTSKN